jgi:tetratricopeptide (TPR) repeat protein
MFPKDVSHFSNAVETSNENLTSKLDTLTAELKQLRTTIPAAESTDEENSRVANNLGECVRSAERLVSEASTMGNRTQAGSVIGSELPGPVRERIHAWIPAPIPEEDESEEPQSPIPGSPPVDLLVPLQGDSTWFPYENHDTQSVQPPGSSNSSNPPITDAPLARARSYAPTEISLDDPSLDVEHELIRRWRRSAYLRFSKGRYSESEELLLKTLERSKIRYGVKFEGRDSVVDTLIAVYDRAANWPKLKKYLLARLQDYENDGNLMQMINIIHDLSEACLGNKELKEAKEWCNKAIRGRKVAFGTDHYLYYQSLDLLSRIHEAAGRTERLEAEGCRDLLPPKTQEGILLLLNFN